jgi:hypothetical protein
MVSETDYRVWHLYGHPVTRLLIDYRFTVESWWQTGGIESTLGIVFETSFTDFERGNQRVIQMSEELSDEKSYCA